MGYLLETVHLQASAIDKNKPIHQHDQTPIDLLNEAYQHITPMVRGAATRNRTMRAEDSRGECIGLEDIDERATKRNMKKLDHKDLMILNMEKECIDME